jgi:S-adenosylmethionine decarboxylase
MTQVLADCYGCEASIEDADALMAAAMAAAASVGATVVGESTVRYVPHGLTIAVFLAESHIVLTTWPEHRLLLIDTLLCNPDMDANVAIDAIAQLLCPRGEVVRSRVSRRIADRPGEA